MVLEPASFAIPRGHVLDHFLKSSAVEFVPQCSSVGNWPWVAKYLLSKSFVFLYALVYTHTKAR